MLSIAFIKAEKENTKESFVGHLSVKRNKRHMSTDVVGYTGVASLRPVFFVLFFFFRED